MKRANSYRDAVAIVRKEISPESARIIHYSMTSHEESASNLSKVGFGVAIRNLLAKNGLIWEEVILASVWLAILREAIQPFIE